MFTNVYLSIWWKLHEVYAGNEGKLKDFLFSPFTTFREVHLLGTDTEGHVEQILRLMGYLFGLGRRHEDWAHALEHAWLHRQVSEQANQNRFFSLGFRPTKWVIIDLVAICYLVSNDALLLRREIDAWFDGIGGFMAVSKNNIHRVKNITKFLSESNLYFQWYFIHINA